MSAEWPSAAGASIEAPKGEGSEEGALPPPQNFFFDFESENGDF